MSNTGEFKRVNHHGDVFWLRASYSPDYDNSGEVVSVTKLASDITQERKIKERTIDISTTTASAIAEMNQSITEIAKSMNGARQTAHLTSSSVGGERKRLWDVFQPHRKACLRLLNSSIPSRSKLTFLH